MLNKFDSLVLSVIPDHQVRHIRPPLDINGNYARPYVLIDLMKKYVILDAILQIKVLSVLPSTTEKHFNAIDFSI